MISYPLNTTLNNDWLEQRGDEVHLTDAFFQKVTDAITVDNIPTGAGIINKTFAQLMTLKNDEELVPGQFYRITDFKTKYLQPVSEIVKESTNPEPLICLAIGVDTISHRVYSEIFREDIIFWDCNDNTVEEVGGSRTGKIYFRHDTDRNIKAWYDWRNIEFLRYESDIYIDFELWDDGVSYSIGSVVIGGDDCLYVNLRPVAENSGVTPESDPSNWVKIFTLGELIPSPTFQIGYTENWGGITVSSNLEPTEYVTFSDDGNNIELEKSDSYGSRYGNNVFLGYTENVYIGSNSQNNTFAGPVYSLRTGTGFSNNIFRSENDSVFNSNIIGDNFAGNHFISLTNNKIGNGFESNNIGSMESNTIGNSAVGNILKTFNHNNITNGFSNNIISGTFSFNTLGDGFVSNMVYHFTKNQVGVDCSNNLIYTADGYSNMIGPNFSGNQIEDTFTDNIIGTDFNNNVLNSISFISNMIGAYYNNNYHETGFVENFVGPNCNNNSFIAGVTRCTLNEVLDNYIDAEMHRVTIQNCEAAPIDALGVDLMQEGTKFILRDISGDMAFLYLNGGSWVGEII